MAYEIPEGVKKGIRRRKAELDALLAMEDGSPEWRKAVLSAKKGLESALYAYVESGCAGQGQYIKGAFPELTSQYDPESYDLLDEKIRVLAKIIKQGPGCDCKSIDGFDDILEKKLPDGEELVTFD